MSPDQLLAVWKSLSDEAGLGSSLVKRRIAPDSIVDIVASYVPSRRSPGMIVDIPAELPLANRDLPECRGIALAIESAGTPADPHTIFRVQLEAADQKEVFAILCADLLSILIPARDPAAALGQAVGRLAAWQALFDRVRKEGLSSEKQRGLFGELHLLRTLLIPEYQPLDSVQSWTGWEPANQDFKRHGLAIECKTSMAKRHARVFISNEKQLDETPHERLFLAFVRLDESDAFGSSLPAMIALVRADLSSNPAARHEFDTRLMQAGYLDIQSGLYDQTLYQVTAVQYFEVRDDFPRLTESNLPPGVGDISYSIIPGDLGEFALEEEAMRAVLRAQK
jgi:hypothetical protein